MAFSGHANVIGLPWCRSGGSHVLAVSTVAVSVTPCVRVPRRSGWWARRRRPRTPSRRRCARRAPASVPGAKTRDAFRPHANVPAGRRALRRRRRRAHWRCRRNRRRTGCRILVDVAGGADLLDAPVVEHREPVAQGQRLVLVVGDDDEGDADLALDRLELDLHLLAQLEVQCAQRLVEQQHPRAPDQRAREGDALTLAAGQLRGLPRRRAGQPDHVECVGGAACGVRPCGTPRTFRPYSTFCATVMCGNSA